MSLKQINIKKWFFIKLKDDIKNDKTIIYLLH